MMGRFMNAGPIPVATNFFEPWQYTVDMTRGGGVTGVHICLVMFYNFVVNFLLILGTDRLSGFPPSLCRVSLAAGVGGVYGGLCLVPSFYFLGHYLWRVVALIATGVVAFGCDLGAARRCVIFLVLCMALSGLVWSVGNVSAPVVLVSAVALNVLCYIGFRGRIGCQEYVKVELNFGGKRLPLTLHDHHRPD